MSEYLNFNTAPPIADDSDETLAKYAGDIKAALRPGEPKPPEPLSEAAIAHLLVTGQTTTEVIELLRIKHAAAQTEYELARSHWMVNRNGRDALNPTEMQELLSDSLAQLRKDGFLRG